LGKKVPVIDFSIFWTVILLRLDSIIKRPAPFRMQHTCQEMEKSLCTSCLLCCFSEVNWNTFDRVIGSARKHRRYMKLNSYVYGVSVLQFYIFFVKFH
jgi:hypothetical protein